VGTCYQVLERRVLAVSAFGVTTAFATAVGSPDSPSSIEVGTPPSLVELNGHSTKARPGVTRAACFVPEIAFEQLIALQLPSNLVAERLSSIIKAGYRI